MSGFKYDVGTGQILSVGHVTSLYLPGHNLEGSIPDSLANLVKLESLSLAYNPLGGSIPDNLGNLVNLRGLYLNVTRLSGSIPASLGNLVNLRRLYLANCQLRGSIPASLGNLVNLGELLLYDNQLSGSIPDSLGNLVNLLIFELYENQLSGSIPDTLGNLLQVVELRIHNNQLSGNVPATLGKLVNLFSLGLGHNRLSGNIPDFSVIAALGEFDVAYNCFDISPGSQVMTVIQKLLQGQKVIVYQPQNRRFCGPAPLVLARPSDLTVTNHPRMFSGRELSGPRGQRGCRSLYGRLQPPFGFSVHNWCNYRQLHRHGRDVKHSFEQFYCQGQRHRTAGHRLSAGPDRAVPALSSTELCRKRCRQL